MNDGSAISTTLHDRWSYLWLVVGTLLGLLWQVPLVWWLTPIFLIRFMRTQKVWRGFLLIWLSSFLVMSLVMYDIMNVLMPGPLPVFIISTAVSALVVGGLPYLADRLLAVRFGGFAATLVFPLAVTAVDFLMAKANPLGSIGGQAYNQYGNLALMQLLSVTGMWGITFLVNWLGPVVNWAWEREFVWPKVRRGLAVFAGILGAVLLFGGARLALAPQPGGTVRMHGITAMDMRENWPALNVMAEEEGWEAMRQQAAQYRDTYFDATEREAEGGAQLVHWPEMALMVPGEDEAAFMDRAQEIARTQGAYLALAVGTKFKDDRPWENKVIVIDPAGEVVLEHQKYALASMEGARGGDGILRTVETPFGTLSAIICNDTNHEEVVLQAGRNGTDILLSPSLEYRAIDPIHAHMAIFRAVENGVTLVRQADNGLSFVVDPYGRVVSEMDHWTSSERVLLAQVPADAGVFTLYPYIGDIFGWLSMIGFVAMAVAAVIRGRRRSS
jgi:apolipoprotein N-acyltransferase